MLLPVLVLDLPGLVRRAPVPYPAEMEMVTLPRGRNSKSSVMKDNARERRVRDQAAWHLEAAANVIRERFTGEDELIGQLDYLAGKIREGQADHTDHLER